MYINPYEITKKVKGDWLKANFHAHAGTGEGTCGAYEIDEVIKLYKEAGYGILTISNHDLFSDTSEYQSKYDITLINGFEYSSDPHMLCIGVNKAIKGTHQDAINECANQGGIIILCHPHWIREDYWTLENLDTLKGYTGIEIYNSLIFRLEGSGLATDIWDHLLSKGKLVWGFGNDDFHRWYDLSRACSVIYSPSGKSEDIQASIKNGSFYVSTGLILNEFDYHEGIIKISANVRKTHVKNNKYFFVGKDGKILSEQYGEYGLYHLNGDEMYVRVQVVSEHGAMLWTQPIFDSELLNNT